MFLVSNKKKSYMEKSVLYSSLNNQSEVQSMNQNPHPNGFAQAAAFGAQQPSQQFTSAADQFQQQQTTAGNTANDTNAASDAVPPNGSATQEPNASNKTDANGFDEMTIPSLLAPNGSLDWDAVVHWSIYKYNLDPTDRSRVKRPVIPLVDQAQKHLLPSSLSIELHKLVKQVYTLTSRSKQNAAHKTCITVILHHTLAMIDLAVVVEKRPSNTQPLYALDEVHEMTRRLWFSLYESGFFGDSKGGRENCAYQGINDFARINKSMDTIGRIIGSLKKKYSTRVDNKKGNVVNSRRFHK